MDTQQDSMSVESAHFSNFKTVSQWHTLGDVGPQCRFCRCPVGKGQAVASPSPLSPWGRFPIFTSVCLSHTGWRLREIAPAPGEYTTPILAHDRQSSVTVDTLSHRYACIGPDRPRSRHPLRHRTGPVLQRLDFLPHLHQRLSHRRLPCLQVRLDVSTHALRCPCGAAAALPPACTTILWVSPPTTSQALSDPLLLWLPKTSNLPPLRECS